MRRLTSICAAITLLLGCWSGGVESRAQWHGSAELVDSVWVVSNPDTPVYDSSQVHLAPEWSVALLPDSAVSWVAPGHVRLLHGITYVLDVSAYRVAAFDTLGRRTAAFGRKGAGPGEMEAPTGLFVTGDAIGVDDGRLGRAVLFDERGSYVGSRSIPPMADVLAIGDSELLARYLQPGEPGWRIISDDSARELGPMSQRGAPYASRSTGCVGDADVGVIVLAVTCTRPGVLLFSPSMHLTRVATVNRQEQHATNEQLERFRGYMDTKLSQVPLKPEVKAGIIETALKNDAIRKDVHGVAVDSVAGLIGIWSQVSQQYGGGNAQLDLLSLSGVYLAHLVLPRSLTAFDLDHGRLVTLSLDSLTGTVTLRSARIVLPEGWGGTVAVTGSTATDH